WHSSSVCHFNIEDFLE
ncbi:hypothetical protein A2U01_0109927, partial [Trifolium medium]|nr:hypothetical protein [Trifolium medium]